MKNSKIIKTVIFTMGMAVCTMAQAFVGSIAVGLGQMDKDIGQIKTSFSADAKLETEDTTTMTHISYQPGMVRDDINLNGQEMVTIHRFDLNKVWILMGQGMYMEVDPDKGSKQAPQYKLISREVIGPDEVNGIPTTKYKSIYESAEGKFGGFTWFTKDNIAVKGFLVQQTNGEKHRIKFEFQNLNLGKQADNLFEIPGGYRKFQMGGIPSMQDLSQGMAGARTAPPANSNAAKSSTQSANSATGDDGGFAGEMVDEAQNTAEDSVKDETKRGIRDTIKKGFGSLFGR